jgi:hypothetical protein
VQVSGEPRERTDKKHSHDETTQLVSQAAELPDGGLAAQPVVGREAKEANVDG